ncbi:hypothetical protein ZOSMA_350G00040 [Zostera marina]|uniref:Uncharacterized protein n=1 Tax=Zostera marina TaxID=29655 RepID=A0A0K9P8Y8_ZOSMR|nr:hypothetical protein ZOSMA_350G00040 [Zostera marina]
MKWKQDVAAVVDLINSVARSLVGESTESTVDKPGNVKSNVNVNPIASTLMIMTQADRVIVTHLDPNKDNINSVNNNVGGKVKIQVSKAVVRIDACIGEAVQTLTKNGTMLNQGEAIDLNEDNIVNVNKNAAVAVVRIGANREDVRIDACKGGGVDRTLTIQLKN